MLDSRTWLVVAWDARTGPLTLYRWNVNSRSVPRHVVDREEGKPSQKSAYRRAPRPDMTR